MPSIENLRWFIGSDGWIASQFLPFVKGPDPKYARRRNIWRLYQDLAWLGIASAASTYITVYAIRLGASAQLIGLQTSIPSLLVVLLRIPAAQMTERAHDRQKLIVWSLAAGRLLYLLLFLLPWLAQLPLLRQIPQAELLVGIVIVMGIPSVLASAGWDTFFADIVQTQQRAEVVSIRNTMSSLMTLTVVPLMGYFLDWAAFPTSYQFIFLAAFVGAAVSTWHVSRIQHTTTPSRAAEKRRALNLREARQIIAGSREFGMLLLATFVYQWGISLASPLFSLFFIEELGASDSWIGWRTTLASLASVGAYRFWPRRMEKLGDRNILRLTAPMMVLFPLLTGLTRTLTPNLFIVLIPQIFGAAVLLSRYTMLLRVSPAERRPTYIAIYAILTNIAAFAAPLVGVSLSDHLGMPIVFFISAGFRLMAALLYWRLPEAAPPTARLQGDDEPKP